MTDDLRFKTNDACMPSCAEKDLAGEEGFEPSHAGIKIRCLNQLGDSPTQVSRPKATNR